MLKYILLAITIAIAEILTYKLIKIIDKKERKKLYNWELKYVENIKKIKQEEYEYIKKTKELKQEGKKNDSTTNTNINDSTDSVSSETE